MSASDHAQLATRAAHLADRLRSARPPVERNTLLTLIADFVADPRTDLATLRRLLRQVAAGEGGHLRVGESYAAQVRATSAILEEELAAADLDAQQYRQLLGWTARLLQTRSQAPAQQRGQQPQQPSRGESPKPQAPRQQPAQKPPRREDRRDDRRDDRRGSGGLGALKQDGLSALEALKKKLEGDGKGKRR